MARDPAVCRPGLSALLAGDRVQGRADRAVRRHARVAAGRARGVRGHGPDTHTGGRIKLLEPRLEGEERFCATYSDGLADVDLDALLAFHAAHGALASMTVVRPRLQFGVTELERDGRVSGFREKPRSEHWINGGFFCFQAAVLDYLDTRACSSICQVSNGAVHCRVAGCSRAAPVLPFRPSSRSRDLTVPRRRTSARWRARRNPRRDVRTPPSGPRSSARRPSWRRVVASSSPARPCNHRRGARRGGSEGSAGARWGSRASSASAASIRSRAASISGCGLGGGEHRGIADRLDEPHGRLGDVGGESFQAHRQTPELIGRHFLAQAGEADEVGEAHGDVARARELPAAALRAPIASLSAACCRCRASERAQQGVEQRIELCDDLGVSAGEVGSLIPGLRTSFRGSMRRLSAAWARPRPSTRRSSRISWSEMPASRATDDARGLELGLGVGRFPGLQAGQAHRPPGGQQEVDVHAAELGHFGRAVARDAGDHAGARQEHERPRGRAAPQLGQRHSFGGDVFEQRQALSALLALQPVEQALGGEVDVLRVHHGAA